MSDLPKFSATERLIIELLAAHEELFGLQMVELSGGRLKRGTVYVTLGRMHEKGYLESRQEPLPEGAIGLPRRLYRPTGLAMRVLAAWQAAEADVRHRRRTRRRRDGDHGTRALAFASRWFDAATVRRTFEPLIADWQREWHESAPSGARGCRSARWAAFVCAAAISSPGVITTPTPRSISRARSPVASRCSVWSSAALSASRWCARSSGRAFDAPLWAALLLLVRCRRRCRSPSRSR